jgi:hypothetical protein
LGNLNILNSEANDWILTSDLLLTGQAPSELGYYSISTVSPYHRRRKIARKKL